MNACFLLPQSPPFLIGYGPLCVTTYGVLTRESSVLPTHVRVFRCTSWKCLIFTIVAPTRLSIRTHFRQQHNLIRCTIMGCLSSLAGKGENRNNTSPIIMGVPRSSWTAGTKQVDFTHNSHLARVLSVVCHDDVTSCRFSRFHWAHCWSQRAHLDFGSPINQLIDLLTNHLLSHWDS